MPLLERSVILTEHLGESSPSHSMMAWKLPVTRRVRKDVQRRGRSGGGGRGRARRAGGQTRRGAQKDAGNSLIFMPGRMMSFFMPSLLRPMRYTVRDLTRSRRRRLEEHGTR